MGVEAAVHTVPERDEFNPHSYFLYLALRVTLLKADHIHRLHINNLYYVI